MSERALWDTARDALSPFLDVMRVENRVEVGTPDVCWAERPVFGATHGWIELKHLPRWPARARTTIVIPELTLDQVLWAEGHGQAHGYHMLLRVGGHGGGYGLLDAAAVRAIYDRRCSRSMVVSLALAWGEAFPAAAILRALTGRGPEAKTAAPRPPELS